jgi:hypothetical protein
LSKKTLNGFLEVGLDMAFSYQIVEVRVPIKLKMNGKQRGSDRDLVLHSSKQACCFVLPCLKTQGNQSAIHKRPTAAATVERLVRRGFR